MTIPIIMFSASGREEWLPKLLLLFLVFGKGKAVLNWLWAVTMWGLTLGKKCWEIFTCISKGHGVWSCAGAALAARSKSWEEVLQKWPWWASTTGSVCACYCAFALHFNSGLCWAHWSSNFTLGDFHYGEFTLVFNIITFSIFTVSEGLCCWCSLHLWLCSQACPDSNILLTCTPRTFSGIMCPCHCTWAEAAGGKGDFAHVPIKYFRILLFFYCADSKMMGLLFYGEIV